jgi:hypothetical protein
VKSWFFDDPSNKKGSVLVIFVPGMIQLCIRIRKFFEKMDLKRLVGPVRLQRLLSSMRLQRSGCQNHLQTKYNLHICIHHSYYFCQFTLRHPVSSFVAVFKRPCSENILGVSFRKHDYNYRTRAIISRGLYTFYPIFEVQKRLFKEIFS